MKLVVTVLEETCARAVEAIRAIELPHDLVEVRAERFPSIDFEALHAATEKPIILTYRGVAPPALDGWRGLIDVEWREGVVIDDPARTVLSHHDYDGVTGIEEIMAKMRALGCAYTKLAATPRNFAENERLLKLLPGTVIGMGERGLYSRILAPFKGSELAFVAATNIAAPGQLTLERAHEIYGVERAERVFAIIGNPAGHSLSPVIHNRLFREKGMPAAYTIASFETFDEIREAFLRGEPCGLSVTTPFKEEALRLDAEVGDNARRANAVNTLVNVNGRILADNTDVDGFSALLGTLAAGRPVRRPLDGDADPRRRAAGEPAGRRPALHRKAAVLGKGPTARAALVALADARIAATMYDRTNMHTLAAFDGDLIINTLPPEADVAIPPCRTYFEAAYSGAPKDVECETRITGLDLLHAQAVRQHQLFMKVFDGL
jgi:shikimate 5-dehydrogenase/3-dehydroquinate dehydratase